MKSTCRTSEIESVYYTFSGMTNVTTDDADTIRRLTAAHRAIVKNRNEQARIADASDADTLSQSDYDDIEPFHLRLTYYLKDGSHSRAPIPSTCGEVTSPCPRPPRRA